MACTINEHIIGKCKKPRNYKLIEKFLPEFLEEAEKVFNSTGGYVMMNYGGKKIKCENKNREIIYAFKMIAVANFEREYSKIYPIEK